MSYPTLFTTPGVRAFAEEIDAERQRQLAKWGDQHHPDGTGITDAQRQLADHARTACQQAFAEGNGSWAHILMEEVREAYAEKDPAALRTELVQCAAVIAAWVADLDSRPAVEETHVVADGSDDPEHVDDCPGRAVRPVPAASEEQQ